MLKHNSCANICSLLNSYLPIPIPIYLVLGTWWHVSLEIRILNENILPNGLAVDNSRLL
jgi:hypothetical protein